MNKNILLYLRELRFCSLESHYYCKQKFGMEFLFIIVKLLIYCLKKLRWGKSKNFPRKFGMMFFLGSWACSTWSFDPLYMEIVKKIKSFSSQLVGYFFKLNFHNLLLAILNKTRLLRMLVIVIHILMEPWTSLFKVIIVIQIIEIYCCCSFLFYLLLNYHCV